MWLAPCVLLAAFFLASGKLLANSSEPFIDDHEILELDFLQVQNLTANEIIEIQDNQEPEESLVIQENKIYDEVEVIPELYLDYAENSTIFKLDDDIDIQDLTRIGLEEDFPDRKSRGVIYGFDVDESNWNGFVTEKFIFSRNWNPNTTLQTPAVFGIVASKDTLELTDCFPATSRFVRQVYGPNRNQRPQEYQQSDEHHEESGAYALKDGSNLSYEVEADSREELKLHQDGSYERNREGHGKAYRKRVGPLRYSVEKVGERVEEQKVLEVRKRKQRVCNGLRTGARIICKDNGKCAFINLGKKYCQYLSHPYCVLEAVCVMKAESTVQEEKKWKVLRKIVPDYQIAMQQSESEEAEEFDYKSQESGYGNKHENRESAEKNDYGNKYQNRESTEEDDDHDETESGGHYKKEEFRETLRGCSGVNVVCELACPSENQCGLLREIKSFCHFIKHPQCIIPPGKKYVADRMKLASSTPTTATFTAKTDFVSPGNDVCQNTEVVTVIIWAAKLIACTTIDACWQRSIIGAKITIPPNANWSAFVLQARAFL
ncbi:unnamed protein product [Notodromas monacha]|uniref:Uncharacterized protein n=1 Tax=Notodromas monacha TaxID=399045 RepID=A0A7R9GKB1_9CRUS|nr:unnamed protein product [Notodromas monacha]CAG0924567.1 unnamed protein product [Notodromas monacha]